MKVKIDVIDFNEKLNGIVDYGNGFITVLVESENKLAKTVAEEAVDSAYTYIDTMARIHSDRLHHVYEWNKVGDSSMRLFKFNLNPSSKNTYQIKSELLNSSMPAPNSGQIFVKKAMIMEAGQPLTIAPKNSKVLAFEINGEKIFTPNEVIVPNPGGNAANGFADIMKDFENYFQVSFARSNFSIKLRKLGRIFNPGKKPTAASGKSHAINFINGLSQL